MLLHISSYGFHAFLNLIAPISTVLLLLLFFYYVLLFVVAPEPAPKHVYVYICIFTVMSCACLFMQVHGVQMSIQSNNR